MPRRGPTIADTALEIIHEQGPQELGCLVPPIVAAGRTKARDPEHAVLAAISGDPRFLTASDGRWYSLIDQLEGAVFTHKVTDFEQHHEIVILSDGDWLLEQFVSKTRPYARGGQVNLWSMRDLFDLAWFDEETEPDADEGLSLTDADDWLNAEARDYVREIATPYELEDFDAIWQFMLDNRWRHLLKGPTGWLPVIAPDDLLGITVRDGVLDTFVVHATDLDPDRVASAAERVAALARRHIGPDPSWFGPPSLAAADLLEMVATEAAEILRRPLPPLAELLGVAALELHEGEVGHVGTDWQASRWIIHPSP